jgi:hypothetical protein
MSVINFGKKLQEVFLKEYGKKYFFKEDPELDGIDKLQYGNKIKDLISIYKVFGRTHICTLKIRTDFKIDLLPSIINRIILDSANVDFYEFFVGFFNLNFFINKIFTSAELDKFTNEFEEEFSLFLNTKKYNL